MNFVDQLIQFVLLVVVNSVLRFSITTQMFFFQCVYAVMFVVVIVVIKCLHFIILFALV